jgi:DNA polymerase-1
MNTPVQGSAADIIKLAMLEVDRELETRRSRLLLQVHDELVVESPEDESEETAGMVKDVMERALRLSVPLKVDVGIGENWATIH